MVKIISQSSEKDENMSMLYKDVKNLVINEKLIKSFYNN